MNHIDTMKQEPVAYAVYHRMGGSKSLHWPEQHSPDGDASQYQLLPLYTSPQPARQEPLTRDQVKAMMVENGYDNASPQERADFINGLRHGEVAHGITKGGAA
jgi:hypothetical protein